MSKGFEGCRLFQKLLLEVLWEFTRPKSNIPHCFEVVEDHFGVTVGRNDCSGQRQIAIFIKKDLALDRVKSVCHFQNTSSILREDTLFFWRE
ncbi:hypothetical protein DPMN_123198 [Dreissena polymorpha]|uniref:Uncharacterized protein n=1 Tax=Dreissena polymorpha TaxID=45954 RepID=A0A9D4JSN6_DREPO|nr:hypothetical protein DPMN_123198 [Dreissena polymorpha]